MILVIVAICIILVASVFLATRFKRFQDGNLTLISGGVKTGKTELSVAKIFKRYDKQLRKWRKACRKARRRYDPLPEKPLVYSNMPIGKEGFEYAPLTYDLITRKKRFRYGSVVYFNEVSLVAGSLDVKDPVTNDQLLELFKLCAHETKGGYFYLDTQAPQDMHFSAKRSLSTYYFILKRLTLPIVSFLWVRENLLVDGENTVAVDTQVDPQDSPAEGGKKWYIVPILNKWWKYYDQYAYSSLTDHLPTEDNTIRIDKNNKKVRNLIRCKDIVNAIKKR